MFVQQTISSRLKDWTQQLVEGDLYGYENELFACMTKLYNYISEQLLPMASCQLVDELVKRGKAGGGGKMEVRPYCFRIATGLQIEVQSPYIKESRKAWSGSRHLVAKHWNIIGRASPALYDRVGFCSALGPSYDVAHQTLDKFGVTLCLSSVRDLTNRLAGHCFECGEENLVVSPQETLEAKRVVISIDGGRTRTRSYEGNYNESGNAVYQTAWCEPKLFVIDILDEQGGADRYELPIYGGRFAEADVLALLKRYLKRMGIEKARQVQILADGAPWIWNNVKQILMDLGVAAERIVETLDYYHASGYIHDLVEQMPKHIGKPKRKTYLEEFKNDLWSGNARRIVETCRSVFKRPGKVVERWLNYLDKHQDKTQYAEFQKGNLMCGSGIVESAIRRIINLRFKNASTFWDKQMVEKLFFLRAALLSKRWDILMRNLTNST